MYAQDEVMYEGNIGVWGGLTAGQMVDRFWWGLSYGIYVGHGETIKQPGLADDDQVLWWSKGWVAFIETLFRLPG